MNNVYGNYLPGKKSLARILLKSLLGVFVGGLLFSLFVIALDFATNIFMESRDLNYFLHNFFEIGEMTVVLVTLLTYAFASIPTTIGGVLLSAIIYRDFKLGIASKKKSVKTGMLLAGLVGLLTSLIVLFTTFRPEHKLALSVFLIPVILIASLIGYWGGLQVHKEIEGNFLSSGDVKEKDQ